MKNISPSVGKKWELKGRGRAAEKQITLSNGIVTVGIEVVSGGENVTDEKGRILMEVKNPQTGRYDSVYFVDPTTL
jgi:hypothetical protein